MLIVRKAKSNEAVGSKGETHPGNKEEKKEIIPSIEHIDKSKIDETFVNTQKNVIKKELFPPVNPNLKRLKTKEISESAYIKHEMKRQVTISRQETIQRQASLAPGKNKVHPEERSDMQRLVRSVTYKAHRSFRNWFALKVLENSCISNW